MEYTREEKAIIWLCGCVQAEYRERAALLRAAGDPARLFAGLQEFARGVIKDASARVYTIDGAAREREADAFLSRLSSRGYFAVTLLSEDYPENLKAIPDPPLVLFGAGNRALLQKRRFCIVGSRLTPPWAEKQAKLFSERISQSFAVVTGFAEGGDRAAIDGACAGGNLICVLPLGLDGCYPAAHASLKEKVKRSGLLLSEYPPEEKLMKYYFHARNRILAGLSEGVLVVSAREPRSGALMTASYAADYGRDVFAFPYNIGVAQGSGCNGLIKKGAYLASCPEDVLSAYGIDAKEDRRETLPPEEARVLALLRENGEMHAAELAEKLDMAVFELTAVLASLEMKNLAVKSGGNRYSAL